LQISQPGAAPVLTGGQTLAIGVRAPSGAREVEFLVNGVLAAKSTQYPWVFTLNIPANATHLLFAATAQDGNGVRMASLAWQQAVVPDQGSAVTGHVVDANGAPVSGAMVSIEAAGLLGEFFALPARNGCRT
jgi:hypothetical protein